MPLTLSWTLSLQVEWPVLKLVQCVCEICEYFVFLNSFEDVESKTFIVRLSVERVYRAQLPITFVVFAAHRPLRRRPPEATAADGPGKAPEASRRSTWRRATARSQLQSFCSRKRPRWMPRTITAGASIREACARNSVSNLGHVKCVSGLKF